MIKVLPCTEHYQCTYCLKTRAAFTIGVRGHIRSFSCGGCLLELQDAISEARKPVAKTLRRTKEPGTVRSYEVAFFWVNSPYMLHETVQAVSKAEAEQAFRAKHPDAVTYAIILKQEDC